MLAAINDSSICAAGIAGSGAETGAVALVARRTRVIVVTAAMEGLKHAIVIAAIAVVGIAVVAIFARLLDSVAANLNVA